MSSSISRDRQHEPVSLEEPPGSISPRSTSLTGVSSVTGPATEGRSASGVLDSLEPAELPAGSQLGNYVILACIGRGAMASVYRAEHSLLNKQVALKVMAPALHASTEARQRFLREARAVAAIQHPNVVSISDAGLFEGTPYLVMELLDGEDLQQHLQHHGPFAAHELPAIALPIVAALAAAHDAGVIHRDLKPGNIFLARGSTGEVVPKLLDFGISKFASPVGPPNHAVTAFNQLMGSPLYLPPEALQGSRELTALSDQYSLGVVLYECVTGQAPFYRDDLVPLLNAICEGSCPAPRQLRPATPPALEQAILRAMSVDPLQRFAHIRELGQALLELAAPHTLQRWSSAFAARGAPVLASPSDSEAMAPASPAALTPRPPSAVVAPAEPPPRAASLVSGARGKRGRLLGAWALLASGCLLLALALGRARGSDPARHRAHLSALDPLGTISHEGNHELDGHAPAAHDVFSARSAGAARSHVAAGSWQRQPAPGSPRPAPVGPPRGPAPVIAAVPPVIAAVPPVVAAVPPGEAAPSAARAAVSSPAHSPRASSPRASSPPASSPAAAQKRPPSARRAAEVEGARELSELFFPDAAAKGTTATRERAAQKAAPAPVPLLVNEAPLFD